MRFKTYDIYQPRIAGCDIVDGITWRGAALTAKQRNQALSEAISDNPKRFLVLSDVRMRKRQIKKKELEPLLQEDGEVTDTFKV